MVTNGQRSLTDEPRLKKETEQIICALVVIVVVVHLCTLISLSAGKVSCIRLRIRICIRYSLFAFAFRNCWRN